MPARTALLDTCFITITITPTHMDIRIVTSEAELDDNAFQALRQYRQIPMMMEYLGEGARMYYGVYGDVRPAAKNSADDPYWLFFHRHFPSTRQKIALISLGCGNGLSEKQLLLEGKSRGYDISYFGVDSSMAMLEMAKENLADVDMPKQLMCADFGTPRFIEEIQEVTRGCDIRIFAFFEGTIGNVEQDYLADVMADMMRTDDYLWLDVAVRPATDAKTDMELFNRYTTYTQTKKMNDLMFLPMEQMGMRRDAGKFVLEMVREDNLGALRFKFLFQLTELATLRHKGRRITFLPNSEILLFNIRAYDPQGLIRFFDAREFEPVGNNVDEGGEQFMFRK